MGLTEAKKYIKDLHKKQGNPYLWPDYLTGLPDKAAIIKKLDEVASKMGEYSLIYIRIANIHPYLLKYGPDKHAEIIQWAAAILKTTADKCTDGFVGTINTHDFIAICKTKNMVKLFDGVRETFRKKISTYYSRKDIDEDVSLSFAVSDGKKVNFGLMKLIAVVADRKLPVTGGNLIRTMSRMCDNIEATGDEIFVVTNDILSK